MTRNALVFGLLAALAWWAAGAYGATLCPPVTSEPSPIFMQALRMTESGGDPDPHTARGDGGNAWGANQVSLRFATDCLREAGIPIRWPLSYKDLVRVIVHLLDPETNDEWARRRAALCLKESPPPYWSLAYRCYRGRNGKDLGKYERRFARNFRAVMQTRRADK